MVRFLEFGPCLCSVCLLATGLRALPIPYLSGSPKLSGVLRFWLGVLVAVQGRHSVPWPGAVFSRMALGKGEVMSSVWQGECIAGDIEACVCVGGAGGGQSSPGLCSSPLSVLPPTGFDVDLLLLTLYLEWGREYGFFSDREFHVTVWPLNLSASAAERGVS